MWIIVQSSSESAGKTKRMFGEVADFRGMCMERMRDRFPRFSKIAFLQGHGKTECFERSQRCIFDPAKGFESAPKRELHVSCADSHLWPLPPSPSFPPCPSIFPPIHHHFLHSHHCHRFHCTIPPLHHSTTPIPTIPAIPTILTILTTISTSPTILPIPAIPFPPLSNSHRSPFAKPQQAKSQPQQAEGLRFAQPQQAERLRFLRSHNHRVLFLLARNDQRLVRVLFHRTKSLFFRLFPGAVF